MTTIVVDFETANRAGVDLREVGAEVYSQHPLTEILCLCLLADYGYGWTWRPGQPLEDIPLLARDPSVIFEAHGAFFEQMIWRNIMVPRYGLPEIPIERWSCTMAAALYRGLPGQLEKLADVLELPERKDMEGSKLTIALSKPMTKAEHMKRWPG